jgi:hypothetical protein
VPALTIHCEVGARLPGQLQAFRASVLGVLQSAVFGPGIPGQRLWENGTVSRLLADGSRGGRLAGLLATGSHLVAGRGWLG